MGRSNAPYAAAREPYLSGTREDPRIPESKQLSRLGVSNDSRWELGRAVPQRRDVEHDIGNKKRNAWCSGGLIAGMYLRWAFIV